MKLKKFNELCDKIISESIIAEPYAILLPGNLFAPVKPFQITKDMFAGKFGFCFNGEDTYAGKVKDILPNGEIIYEVSGNYSKRMVPDINNLDKEILIPIGYNGFRCKSFLIKYKLEPGEHYYICEKDIHPYETESNDWDEVIYQIQEPNADIEIEDGEGCTVGGGGEGAGITTNSVFGSGNTAGDSVIQHAQKDPNGPGITTADMKAMYTLSLNPKTKKPKKNYPVFKRIKIVKESSNKNEEHKCCANCIHLDEWNECGWKHEFIPNEEIYDSYCDQWKESLN